MRRLAVVVGAVVLGAVLAVGLVRLFSEPTCPGGDDGPVPVLVAKKLIPEGESGDEIARRRMYALAVIQCIERKPEAVADPAELAGKAAAFDIFPGQQLTEDDFTSR